jgi:hypothetical protein
MKRISCIVGAALFGLAVLSPTGAVCARETPFWKTIQPGPYGIGYAVYHEHDESRAYRPAVPADAEGAQAFVARPIQISVWYPAAAVREADRMDLVDYPYAGLSQFDFARAGTIPREAFIAQMKAVLVKRGAEERRVDEMMSATTCAARDASWADGYFPVIVYGAGYESSAWENSVLFEYLASNGFIVVSSPSFGAAGVVMTDDFTGLEAKVRDHEFIMAFAKRLPHADPERIGALGFSFGGLSTTIFAMRNGFVRAVVCLDGSMAYPAGRVAAETHPDYRPASLAVPFMFCAQKPTEHGNTDFFDELVGSDAWFVEFAGLAHEDFASRLIASDLYMMGKAAPRDAAAAIAGYETMCRYTLAFFKASLLADGTAAAFLAEDPATHGAGVAVRHKVALPPQQASGRDNGPHAAADPVAEKLARFAGEYDADGTVVRVEMQGRRLLLHIPDQGTHEYLYEGGRTFRHAKYKNFTLVFLIDQSGAVTHAISHQGFADFVMKRK